MKLFVTGGAGFIGSNFIRHILSLSRAYRVVNYDKLTYAGNLANLEAVEENPNYSFVRRDICDAAAVEQAMRGCDAVVHFAAESHVDRSIYEPAPAIETNVTGTFTLLQVARKLRVERFVHISTDEVYGDLAPGMFAEENSPLRPSSPYSASKAASDLLVLSYVRTYGFPALITRSSNNYGPFQFPEKFLPLMITNAMDDKPLPIYGDGQQQRDWLHVQDNCRGVLAVLERGKSGRFTTSAASTSRKTSPWPGACFAYWASLRRCSPTSRIGRATTVGTLSTAGRWRKNSGGSPRLGSTTACGRRSSGTRRIPHGWREFETANIALTTKNITSTAIPHCARLCPQRPTAPAETDPPSDSCRILLH